MTDTGTALTTRQRCDLLSALARGRGMKIAAVAARVSQAEAEVLAEQYGWPELKQIRWAWSDAEMQLATEASTRAPLAGLAAPRRSPENTTQPEAQHAVAAQAVVPAQETTGAGGDSGLAADRAAGRDAEHDAGVAGVVALEAGEGAAAGEGPDSGGGAPEPVVVGAGRAACSGGPCSGAEEAHRAAREVADRVRHAVRDLDVDQIGRLVNGLSWVQLRDALIAAAAMSNPVVPADNALAWLETAPEKWPARVLESERGRALNGSADATAVAAAAEWDRRKAERGQSARRGASE